MINFPIFERLEIKNYGLYPGTQEKPGIDIHFLPGLTLILGANGLGKTTLVTVLYRMLTGAYDLPQATLEAAELGGASLDIKPLNTKDKAVFANRVQDLATNATATLQLSIAKKQLRIRRRLKDLSLVTFHVDNSEQGNDEEEYQKRLSELSSVPGFGDWLLLLRHMVFYFEDRRELVWDTSAQRHIFRTLFLPPEEARSWYQKEREILGLDSRYRNDTAALNRMKRRIATDERAIGDDASLRAELVPLIKLQEEDEIAYSKLVTHADELDIKRHELRKELLVAETNVDDRTRTIESEKLMLLKQYFPSEKQTAQHIYSLIIAQNHCAICGNEAESTAKELSARITNLECVVCGSNLDQNTSGENIISISKERVRSLYEKLEADKKRAIVLKDDLSNVLKKYDSVANRLVDTRAAIAERAKQIRRIENALPKNEDDEKLANVKSDFNVLSEALSGDRAELTRLTTLFKNLVDQANNRILEYSDSIKEAFATFAHGFLAEDAQLKWSPVSENLGQTGSVKIVFPAFNLEMSGSDFTGRAPRTGPEAVSESQREFIDLAFRMALIQVAGKGLGGSLVIDAPESSLDAFFVKRAANVLCQFGKPDSNNRLVVASNLIDGQLLPEMIKGGIPPEDRDQRLVNLIKVAFPTAALNENRLEYEAELDKLLASGGLDE